MRKSTINNSTAVAAVSAVQNTNEGVFQMKKAFLSCDAVTKALKTTLVEAGIKFPKTLTARIDNKGFIRTNAVAALQEKARTSSLVDHGDGKKIHSFPYEVAYKSAIRINEIAGSDLFYSNLEKVLVKIEERESVLAIPTISERTEKMIGMIAAYKTMEYRKEMTHKLIGLRAVSTVNKKIVSNSNFHYESYQQMVEVVSVHKPKMNVGKYIQDARKRILKKSQSVTVNVLKVTEDKAGKFHTAVLISTMDENEAIRRGYIKPCVPEGQTYNARFGKLGYETDNFSKDLLVIDLQGAPKASFSMMEIFVWWNGVKTVFATKQGSDYIDLTTNKVISRRSTPRIYKVIGGSPSSLRKSQTLAFDTTDGMEKMDKMLDALTEGAYSKEYGKKIDSNQLAKYVTRYFSWTAPNKVVGEINNPAIYFGKWCNDALDGAGFIFSKFYAKCMEQMTGLKVSPKDVVGLGVQCRPYSAKVFAPVVKESLFKLLCAEAKKVVYIETVTPEISKKLDQAFYGRGEYANCVVVFGPEGIEPEFISDLNGYKTVFNWGQPTGLRVLDIAKSGIAHTSIQMWEVPLDVNANKCIDLMKQLREEMVGNIFDQLFVNREVKVPSFIDIVKNFYPQNIIKSIAPDYVLDKDLAMLKSVIEELATRDNNASNKFKWEIDGEYARLTSDLSLICGKLGILQYGEGYCPSANQYFANGNNAEKYFGCEAKVREMWGKRIVSMFKYPKMGRREFYRFTALPLEIIIDRINNLEINEEYKKALIEFFRDLKPGIAVIPGCELLKQQCAGLDFDYDGATLVFDCRFNALLPEDICITNIMIKDNKVTVIGQSGLAAKVKSSAINSDSRLELKAENLHYAYLTYLNANNDGWSVGSVTNCNSTQIAVLQLVKSTRHPFYVQMMREMLGRWFGNDAQLATGGIGEYKGLPKRVVNLCNMDGMFAFESVSADHVEDSTHATVTDVSKTAINAAIEEMIDADWGNEENLIHIFEDLNDMFRFYQEIIIDSAKTGEMVKVAIAPGRKYHAAMLNDNKLNFAWDYELNKSKFNVLVNENAPTANKQIFKDRLFRIRTTVLAKDLEDTMQALFETKECRLNITDLEVLGRTFANEKYKELNKSFFFLKKIYGDVTRHWQNDRELAGDDAEALALVNRAYKKEIKRIANMGRKLTSNMSDYRRGAYSKFVSAFTMDKNGNCSPASNGGNNFGANVFQKEFMEFIIKHYAQINFCGEKLSYNACYQDGDVITLNHGISEYAVTTADITGEFIVREFNGSFYATKSIVEVLPETTVTDEVTIRVSKETDRSFKDICDTLTKGMKVTLHAYCDVSDRNNKVFDFNAYNEDGQILFGIDEGNSALLRQVINNKQGKIESVIYDTTIDIQTGYEKEFLIVTVK